MKKELIYAYVGKVKDLKKDLEATQASKVIDYSKYKKKKARKRQAMTNNSNGSIA